MSGPQFYGRPKAMTVGEIATLTGASPSEGADLAKPISNVAPVDLAGPDDLSFVDNARYADALSATRAGALLTTERFAEKAPAGIVTLRARDPYRAFVMVARAFYPDSLRPSSPYGASGVDPGARVHPTARIADGATVDPGVVIGAGAQIGTGTVIAANAVIGANVQIGRDCSIGPNSCIVHSVLGDRVIIHPGCHIGQDGFGYISDARGHMKVPQIGRVMIHNDVEVGSGSKIDRGGVRDTVIGAGTKIDNLVQIGHNVVIGTNCIIVAQSGLSGSVTLEDNVVLAARVGIVPHITVGKGAQLAARATVIRDVPAGARWGGHPNAKPIKQWMREMVVLERLGAPGGKAPDADDGQDG